MFSGHLGEATTSGTVIAGEISHQIWMKATDEVSWTLLNLRQTDHTNPVSLE
jgi:hypothetical protein